MKVTLKVDMELPGDVSKAIELNNKIENFLTALEPLQIVKSLTFEHDFVSSVSKFDRKRLSTDNDFTNISTKSR